MNRLAVDSSMASATRVLSSDTIRTLAVPVGFADKSQSVALAEMEGEAGVRVYAVALYTRDTPQKLIVLPPASTEDVHEDEEGWAVELNKASVTSRHNQPTE